MDGFRQDLTGALNSGVIGTDYIPHLTLGASVDPVAGTTASDFAKEVRAQFYLALTQGVRGVEVWSYELRSGFTGTWRDAYFDAYAHFGRELNSLEPDLGKAILCV